MAHILQVGGGGYVQASRGAGRSLLWCLASVQGELGAPARGPLVESLTAATDMRPFALFDMAAVIAVVTADLFAIAREL